VREVLVWVGGARDSVLCCVFVWFAARFWRRGRGSAAQLSAYNQHMLSKLLIISSAGFVSFLFINVRNLLISQRFVAGNVAAVLSLVAADHFAMTLRGVALVLVLSLPRKVGGRAVAGSGDAATGAADPWRGEKQQAGVVVSPAFGHRVDAIANTGYAIKFEV